MRISSWISYCCSSDLRKVVLVATGFEVHLALECAAALEAQGIGADVVSLVCAELFDEQDANYRADVFPADALKVSIEAGTTFGWERYTGTDGIKDRKSTRLTSSH